MFVRISRFLDPRDSHPDCRHGVPSRAALGRNRYGL
jgi:hypothetical protein